ncbi:MAG TPA: hypothetical protein VG454_02085 [Gemmatimonadales bacterium]|nr:hypothetical protein [Gemmatimonadales bacterium]
MTIWPSGRPAVAQQVAPNRANAYLFPTDVKDARAIWVNPAGLGVQREASVYAELAVGDPGSSGKLRQVNAGFNARGLAFGYQHDILDDGVHGNTYRLGFAGGSEGLAAGLDIVRYGGGGAKATGWDLGARYVALPPLTVGLVVANIGQPIVRGLEQRLTFVPALTWRPATGFTFSTDARITPDSAEAYAFGLSWQSGGGTAKWPLGIIARLDTDKNLRRGAFAFGLSIGGQDQFGTITTTPGDVSNIDEASLYGLSSRQPAVGRR